MAPRLGGRSARAGAASGVPRSAGLSGPACGPADSEASAGSRRLPGIPIRAPAALAALRPQPPGAPPLRYALAPAPVAAGVSEFCAFRRTATASSSEVGCAMSGDPTPVTARESGLPSVPDCADTRPGSTGCDRIAERARHPPAASSRSPAISRERVRFRRGFGGPRGLAGRNAAGGFLGVFAQ